MGAEEEEGGGRIARVHLEEDGCGTDPCLVQFSP